MSNTVDLDQLKKQKQWLVELPEPHHGSDELEGLLNFLDYIQDQLEDNGYVRLVELE